MMRFLYSLLLGSGKSKHVAWGLSLCRTEDSIEMYSWHLTDSFDPCVSDSNSCPYGVDFSLSQGNSVDLSGC